MPTQAARAVRPRPPHAAGSNVGQRRRRMNKSDTTRSVNKMATGRVTDVALACLAVTLLSLCVVLVWLSIDSRATAARELLEREATFRAGTMRVALQSWTNEALSIGLMLALHPNTTSDELRQLAAASSDRVLSISWLVPVADADSAVSAWQAKAKQTTGCTEADIQLKVDAQQLVTPTMTDPESGHLVIEQSTFSTPQGACETAVGFDFYADSGNPGQLARRQAALEAAATRMPVASAPIVGATVGTLQTVLTPVFLNDTETGTLRFAGAVSSAFFGSHMLDASGAGVGASENFLSLTLVDEDTGVVMSTTVDSSDGVVREFTQSTSRTLSFGGRTWRLDVAAEDSFADVLPRIDFWTSLFTVGLVLVVSALAATRVRTEAVVLESVTRLLYQTSHDMRTPLHAIAGCADELEPGVDETRKEAVETIRWCATLATAIVDNVLDVKHIAMGTLMVSNTPTSVRGIVRMAVRIVRAVTDEELVDVVNMSDDEHSQPEPLVEVDGEKLLRVLMNVIGNAAKFTHEGHVRVTTVLESAADAAAESAADAAAEGVAATAGPASMPTKSPLAAATSGGGAAVPAAAGTPSPGSGAEGGGGGMPPRPAASRDSESTLSAPAEGYVRLVITVEDTGQGMDAATLASATRPYVHADRSVGGGSGLGLHVAESVTKLYNGGLTLHSEGRGKGSTAVLWMYLRRAGPLSQATGASISNASQHTKALSASGGSASAPHVAVSVGGYTAGRTRGAAATAASGPSDAAPSDASPAPIRRFAEASRTGNSSSRRYGEGGSLGGASATTGPSHDELSVTSRLDVEVVDSFDEDDDAIALVLVVDDSRINRRVCNHALRSVAGIRCIDCRDGAEALKAMQKVGASARARRTFVFMDISMPVMGGDEATATYRLWASQQSPPIARERQPWVCALTGDVTTAKAEFIANGFDQLLTKPCEPSRLRHELVTAIKRRRPRALSPGSAMVVSPAGVGVRARSRAGKALLPPINSHHGGEETGAGGAASSDGAGTSGGHGSTGPRSADVTAAHADSSAHVHDAEVAAEQRRAALATARAERKQAEAAELKASNDIAEQQQRAAKLRAGAE